MRSGSDADGRSSLTRARFASRGENVCGGGAFGICLVRGWDLDLDVFLILILILAIYYMGN